MIRHFIRQPFKASVVKEATLPKHVDCAACVRENKFADAHGRGRRPTHTCNDTCYYHEVHKFEDPELFLVRSGAAAAEGAVAADIACLAASFQVGTPPPLEGDSVEVPTPVFRRLVCERNEIQNALTESPQLRRMAGGGLLPPEVGGVVPRQMQSALRTELNAAAEIEHDLPSRAQRIKNGAKTANIIKIHTVSTKQREPAVLAVILRPSEEARKCVVDKDWFAAIHESCNEKNYSRVPCSS